LYASGRSERGKYFYGETDCVFRGSLFQAGTIRIVSVDYDHQAQAQTAMQWAVTATCERERLGWVRIALAWLNLAPAGAMPPRTETHVTSGETRTRRRS
jgi:hypothetical protein